MTPKFIDEDALERRLWRFARDMNLISEAVYQHHVPTEGLSAEPAVAEIEPQPSVLDESAGTSPRRRVK